MTKTLITAILLSIISITTSAANWVEIDRNEDRVIEVDLESLKNIGTIKKPIAKAWVKLTSFVDTDSVSTDEYIIGSQQLDCSERKILYLSSRIYNIQGKVRTSSENNTKEYEDVIPDSMGETVLKGICSTLKLKSTN